MPRALALLPLVLCTTLAHALTIEVAPGGAVNSLAAARDAVRAARAKDDKSEMRVVVAAGTYALTEPVVFEPQDSGVTYEAAPGAQPVFAGGKKITDWHAVRQRPQRGADRPGAGVAGRGGADRPRSKSTRLNSSHPRFSRMPSSA